MFLFLISFVMRTFYLQLISVCEKIAALITTLKYVYVEKNIRFHILTYNFSGQKIWRKIVCFIKKIYVLCITYA